jgi:hypothetical protein
MTAKYITWPHRYNCAPIVGNFLARLTIGLALAAHLKRRMMDPKGQHVCMAAVSSFIPISLPSTMSMVA